VSASDSAKLRASTERYKAHNDRSESVADKAARHRRELLAEARRLVLGKPEAHAAAILLILNYLESQ
jgi:hypothetical protein